MGPSGSGKTTLLDVLAGRKTQGEIEGEILFSARQPNQNFLRRFTGYVEQFDTLIDILSVREMLLYTADLKRPLEESKDKKAAVVDFFIEKLGLDRCKDTRIGNSLNRCAPPQLRVLDQIPSLQGHAHRQHPAPVRPAAVLQRRDVITKHQFALHLIRDSTVIPN